MIARQHYQIGGTVQGVGFRPFVYRHAIENQLTGNVLNDADGVFIEVQGPLEALAQFEQAMRHQLPPLAKVDRFELTSHPVIDTETEFSIIASQAKQGAQVALATDKASCPECLAEIGDPSSRYYNYPFTNCTNCGPRYTIIRDLPYDRPLTAMAEFEMCPECAKEYQDPLNRRYHAQPVSCPHCGPKLSWRSADGKPVECKAPLQQCIDALAKGQVIAVKGLGGYHLMCDASNELAVATLRKRKHRPSKPLAVMVANETAARTLVQGDDAEWQMLTSQERPVVIMRRQAQTDSGPTAVAANVAPGIDRLGVFLPYTPIHQLLLNQLKRPLVATSANLSGEPVITELEPLLAKLGSVVDGILDHDRPILNPCDDSVVQVVCGRPQWWRLARGIAPQTEPLPPSLSLSDDHCILAVGAQQKNRLSLAFGSRQITSPHIGDLDNLATETYFERTLEQLSRIYQLTPSMVVSDRHPGYGSSQWAQQYTHAKQLPLLQVQHHYAHLLAVMAEHQHTGPVLGFAFDGTGLGDDGSLWGGEVLKADVNGYERLHHIKPFRLIGGEQAIKQPYRIALSLMFEQMSLEQVQASCWPKRFGLSSSQVANLHLMWQRGINSPYSSSMGRLFDAVAAWLGVCLNSDFDGQTGMMLEAIAESGLCGDQDLTCETDVELKLSVTVDGYIDTHSLVEAMINRQHESIPALALGFIKGIAQLIAEIANAHPQLPLVLAGGVMQNRILLEQLQHHIDSERWLWPMRTAVNDSSLAQGQLWFALNQSQSSDLSN